MISLQALAADGNVQPVDLEIRHELEPSIRLSLADGTQHEFDGSDLFECLTSARIYLEGCGLLLCCQGARPCVFPSGLNRQMSNGRLAYPLRRDPPLTDNDLVDIFSPAEIVEVGTVEEQRKYVSNFFGFSKNE